MAESVGLPHLQFWLSARGTDHFFKLILWVKIGQKRPDKRKKFHPLATASSPSQAVPASEWLGKHTGLMFSGERLPSKTTSTLSYVDVTTCEVHCEGQVDEGEVVVQVELAPARMSEEVGGDNLGNDFKEC